MIGGDDEAFDRLEPIFASLAPGVDAAPRTPGARASPPPEEHGYLHCGRQRRRSLREDGAQRDRVRRSWRPTPRVQRPESTRARALDEREADAETAPLAHPEHYRYELDLAAMAELWRRGSVVSSWLLDLTAAALARLARSARILRPRLRLGRGSLDVDRRDREGRPTPVLTAALYSRFASRGEADFANRLLSAHARRSSAGTWRNRPDALRSRFTPTRRPSRVAARRRADRASGRAREDGSRSR